MHDIDMHVTQIEKRWVRPSVDWIALKTDRALKNNPGVCERKGYFSRLEGGIWGGGGCLCREDRYMFIGQSRPSGYAARLVHCKGERV